MENSTALPSPPPASSTVSPGGVSVGVPEIVDARDEGFVGIARGRVIQMGQRAGDLGPALLHPAHGLDHVAGKARMQIAKVADGAAVGTNLLQDLHLLGLGKAFRLD